MNPAAARTPPLTLPAWRSRAVLLALLFALGLLLARALSICRGSTTISCSRKASRATAA